MWGGISGKNVKEDDASKAKQEAGEAEEGEEEGEEAEGQGTEAVTGKGSFF